jgi:K+-transporting ATPase KdpF subunit
MRAARRKRVTFEYIVGGIVAALAGLFLVYVLIWPEKF